MRLLAFQQRYSGRYERIIITGFFITTKRKRVGMSGSMADLERQFNVIIS